MDTSSLSTNTLDTSCFGTFQVSSDSFSSCVQMSSSPTSSNSDKTFTITPKNNYSISTVYRIRITTGTKDSSGNSLTSQWTTSSGFQTGVPPILTEVTVVTTPTNDTTPNYTFSSTEAGTITYGGSCSSGTTSATIGNNTIFLVSLSIGTYSDCTITVTDAAGNVSSSLTLTSFTVAEQMGGSFQGVELSLSTVVTTLAGTVDNGSANGTGTSASFYYPRAITTDGTNLYVADSGNHLIRKIVISTGAVTTVAGTGSSGSANGTGTSASFSSP